ncbi:MAG TPA: SHOCT domain-containing protein [Herpetosiphonaceae bacterium]
MAESDKEHEEAGRLAGWGAGAIAGAQIGTVLLPLPLIGTFTGALIGGTLGSRIGRQVGPRILNTFDSLVSGQPAQAGAAGDEAVSAPAASGDLLGQLERLGQLRTQGLLTDAEFESAKKKLLG